MIRALMLSIDDLGDRRVLGILGRSLVVTLVIFVGIGVGLGDNHGRMKGGPVDPAGPLDGPTTVMLDLARVPPPAATLQSTQPPIIRALVGQRTLPIATRVEIAERGEALAIIEATRLGDLYVQAVKEGGALPPAILARRTPETDKVGDGKSESDMSPSMVRSRPVTSRTAPATRPL